MILSILIPTLASRRQFLDRLMANIGPQLTPSVEVLTDTTEPPVSTGAKRQRLMERSVGRYIAFVDDDDLVADDYIAIILKALETAPDCVGFKVKRFVDGNLIGQAIHSIKFTEFRDKHHVVWRECERCPNHLNPVKRELALTTGFPDITCGEDRDYAHRLRPLLNTEVFINEYLYFYYQRIATKCSSTLPSLTPCLTA